MTNGGVPMIVTCPNCSTKFNLPETQAAPGAKLRCSVCKHVFQLSDGVKPAEIRMEPDLSLSSPSLSMPPKKKGGIWGWVLTLLLLCAVAGGTWWAWTYTPLFDTVKEMIAPPKKQDPVELGVSGDNREGLFLGLGKSYLHYNRYDTLPEVFAQIEKITAGQILEVANEVLAPERLFCLIYE